MESVTFGTRDLSSGRKISGPGDFEACLPLIDDVIGYVCRRQCLGADEAEDFASSVKLHLLEDDCAVLRRFSGRSKLSTYLTTIVLNLARDHRIRQWGRWRPSAAAVRLGEVAVQMETLTLRDGRSFREAVEILRTHFNVELKAPDLADLASQLPVRVRRRFEGEEKLERLAGSEAAERRLLDAAKAEMLDRAEAALARALRKLPVEDRLILKMRYQDGLKLAGIARSLGLAQRPLYSRVHRCLAHLRREIEEEGVDSVEVLEALGWAGSNLKVDFAADKGVRVVEPSVESTEGRSHD
jgi:RNA polymerase sigma factor for flagellar operon FliA